MDTTHSLHLTPENNNILTTLCGSHDYHLRQIETAFGVRIYNRGHIFHIQGNHNLVNQAINLLKEFYKKLIQSSLTMQELKSHLDTLHSYDGPFFENSQAFDSTIIQTLRRSIRPYNFNQSAYLQKISQLDINFGIGPAGTGKTYLAVASAVTALENREIERIVLVRPAVEAGEKLGFLPGDFSQKLDPYFKPLYDALYEMLGFKQTMSLIENHKIEIIPLAYMRGRTLHDAFILLDEAQNTTKEQMKMFLTRIGLRSKAVVSGDPTQIDLPKGTVSGLQHCLPLLQPIQAIGFTYFTTDDVIRHALVKSILKAYEEHFVSTVNT